MEHICSGCNKTYETQVNFCNSCGKPVQELEDSSTMAFDVSEVEQSQLLEAAAESGILEAESTMEMSREKLLEVSDFGKQEAEKSGVLVVPETPEVLEAARAGDVESPYDATSESMHPIANSNQSTELEGSNWREDSMGVALPGLNPPKNHYKQSAVIAALSIAATTIGLGLAWFLFGQNINHAQAEAATTHQINWGSEIETKP
jgi:hypothetical protein